MAEITVIVGTYTGGIIGLRGPPRKLEVAFSYSPSHFCIRSMKIVGHMMYAGGVDEMIRVFDLEKKAELGTLLDGEGSINEVAATRSHVLVASDSGAITIWRVKDWAKLHTMKGPKSGVVSVSLHPTDRMALTGSKNGKLSLWNLVKGRAAFQTKLGRKIDNVQWSPCGLFYAVLSHDTVLVTPVSENMRHESEALSHTQQLTAMVFAGSAQVILAADIAGSVIIWDTTEGKRIDFQAEQGRITAIDYATVTNKAGESIGIVVTVSTHGDVKVWNVSPAVQLLLSDGYESGQSIENTTDLLLASHSLDCRCSALAITSQV